MTDVWVVVETHYNYDGEIEGGYVTAVFDSLQTARQYVARNGGRDMTISKQKVLSKVRNY